MAFSTLEEFKSCVDKIVRDRVSIAEIKELAEKIQIQLQVDQDFSYHKKIVLVGLLKQILRSEIGENDEYQSLLQETQRFLNLPKQRGYSCTYVGCFFLKPDHRDYIKHLEAQFGEGLDTLVVEPIEALGIFTFTNGIQVD